MNDTTEIKKKPEKKLLYPFWAMLLGSIMLVMTALMPMATASTEFREYLEANPNTVSDKLLDMPNKETINLSLIKLGKIYTKAMKIERVKAESITYLVIITVFIFFSLLSLLLSWLKKPIGTIVSGLLALATFILLKAEFTFRGIIPNNRYVWGFAPPIIYISIAATLAGAVILIFLRHNNHNNI
ncbi:MAG: hypothetical protein SPL15_00535 [Lachnospiraceae bacterium]|nr:hypothetical protein [Lachnospiraceae bacterium]MDY5741474.1 hypothetical protein [Lachnospiraceae bacterium]